MNGARGEVELSVDGRPQRLCLTLGALAEIETALDAHGEALGARLRRPSAADLLTVVAALMRGAGGEITDAELAHAALDPGDAAEAVAAAFQAAFS